MKIKPPTITINVMYDVCLMSPRETLDWMHEIFGDRLVAYHEVRDHRGTLTYYDAEVKV